MSPRSRLPSRKRSFRCEPTHRRPRGNSAATRRRGFTMVETMIAVGLMSVVLIAAISLFVNASAAAAKSSAYRQAATGSGQALQKVCDDLKEAYAVILPDYTATLNGLTWEPGNNGQYHSVTGRNAGAYVYAPPTTTAPVNGGIAILDRAGKGVPAYLIYRGREDGAADPNSGKYLWKMYASDHSRELVVSNLSTTADAVQFKILTTGLTRSVEVKIVCGEWSYAVGEQSSDNQSATGNRALGIAGRTVALRNAALADVGVRGVGIGPNDGPPSANATPTPEATPTPNATPTPEPSPSPSGTPEPSPSPSASPSPSPSASPTATPTPPPLYGAG